MAEIIIPDSRPELLEDLGRLHLYRKSSSFGEQLSDFACLNIQVVGNGFLIGIETYPDILRVGQYLMPYILNLM